jgi:hypothetical protein
MVCLPFGRHKGQELPTVPSSYLEWLVREAKLSSGLRQAVAAELARRGIKVPDPPPRPEPRCRDHPAAGYRALWGEDSLGRKFIRCECCQCHQAMGHLPLREPYVSQANATASPTPLLDALVGLEEAGAELCSDGKRSWIGSGYKQVPQAVRDAHRQEKHTLAKMIGDNRGGPGR